MNFFSRQARGITMMELMVVLGIVAVMAGLSVPLFTGQSETARLKQSAESYYNSLVKARDYALLNRSAVNVSFVQGTDWCYGVNAGSPCACDTPGDCSLGQYDSNQYDGHVSDLSETDSGSAGSINFEGVRGTVDVNEATVVFTANSGNSISVIVNQMGSPRVCSSTVVGYDPC